MTFNPLELAKQLGEPEGPTVDMVQRGYHGNGVWPSDPQAMQTLQEQSRKKGAARRAARILAFDEKLLDGIKDSAGLQVDLVKEARRIMRACDDGNRSPTPIEMDLIKRGQVAAEKIPDRIIGKSTQKHEHSGQIDFVGLIAGVDDVTELDATDVEWEEDEDSDEESVGGELEAADDDEDSW